jgi:23S rRNA pseudouridine2605 synthase
LTAEQLQAARAAHWRQNQSPILTLDEAQSWVRQHPLCLYLPRRAQLPVPAPSFVEACLGSAHATPGAAAIEQAHGLLTRLIASGTVVALNLLGAVSEQPDFLAHSEALPFILALRGDADWKHAPQKSSGHKVSPLVLELWKVLDQEGTSTASAARETLGRELTEAAVLRALCELWQGLRISPAFAADGQPAAWELLRVRHRVALATGSTTSQVTAISLLVSMYLQSVYAASSEEIEIFLSPLASRSRVREAVRGLSATRQIHSLSMDAQTYHFIEGGLPEFAEVAVPPAEKRESARPETARRPLPPPRKDQRARPMRPPALLPPPPISPLVARPRTERRPERKFRPEDRPGQRPAQPSRPAARTDGKRPGRSGPPARPWRPQTAAPAASGRPPAWRGKDGDARPSGTARPVPGSPRPTGRSFPRADARADTRLRAGGGAPQAGRRASHGDFPPRPRPGQKSGFGQRPARGPGDASFRGPQKHRDRPAASRGTSGPRGAEPFRPRAPQAEQRPPSSYRPQGRPASSAAHRPSGPAAGRPAASFRPRAPQGRQRPGQPGGKPSYRPTGRPAPSFRPQGEQRSARPAASDKRPGGFSQTGAGAKSSPGRSNQGGGAPFVPKPKPWPRSGSAGQKPRGNAGRGRPPASLRKPDRKKTGA